MRRWLYIQLDAAAWPGPALSPVNRIVAVAILAASAVAVLETEPDLRSEYGLVFGVLDIVFGLFFVCEYAVRVWAAGEDPHFAGFTGRLRYAVTPVALVDLVAIIPFVLTLGLSDAFLLRLLRLLRLFTLVKLGRYSAALRNIFTALRERQHELFMSLAAAFMVMLMSASALHFTEGARNPESFGSIPRALWWGVATVTKVGYAGAFPETVLGKLFSAVFAIASVGVVAMPTGILAAAFSDAFRRERNEREPGE